MKNKRFGLLLILAFAALASSCGTSGYYASMTYDDGIYYRPSKEQRAQMIAQRDAEREKAAQRQYDQYLAKDEDGTYQKMFENNLVDFTFKIREENLCRENKVIPTLDEEDDEAKDKAKK